MTPAHLLVKHDQTVCITGFALQDLLLFHRREECAGAYLNAGHIPLFPREYTAPEVLSGQMPDSCSDVYALGVILFEALSSTCPVASGERGESSHAQPLPSLHVLCPSLPFALEQVIQRALDPLPARRYQSAGEVAAAFAQAVRASKIHQLKPANVAATLEQDRSTGKWQIVPPIITGKISAVAPLSRSSLVSASLSGQTVREAPLPPDLSEKAFHPTEPAIIKTSSPPLKKYVAPAPGLETGRKRVVQEIFFRLAVGGVATISGFIAVQWAAALVHLPHLSGGLFP